MNKEPQTTSTKHNSHCLAKAADDEPIFVLRAQDYLAPAAVRVWATMAKPTISEEKYQAAMRCVEEMERWPTRKLPT